MIGPIDLMGGWSNQARNTPSAGNSSTATLTSAAVFTGAWEDVSAYSDVVVAVSTDQDGSYAVQFSPDGVNVDSTLTRYYRTGQINAPHRFTVTRQYMRVVYTNGSSAQTHFRLQTLLGAFTELNAPTDGTLARDFDAIVVRPTLPDDEVALGKRQGITAFLKFGYNEDVDSASPEVIASFGGTFTPLASAETMDVVSSSTDDDGSPAGIGAQTLLVSGIDANRESQTEVVTMNGTTAVTTSNTWLGINRVVVLAAGTSQGNVGNITVTATTAATNQAYIPAGSSVTQQCIFFTQAGHNGLVRRITVNCLKLSGASPVVTVKLMVWNPGVTNAIYTLRRIKMDTSAVNDVRRDFDPPLLLSPTDVAWLECETDQNNTVVDAEIDILEVKQVDA